MEIISRVSQMQARSQQLKRESKAIGFVPTMGALHEGHLSLMRRARAENDVLVISIFVNPTQFGPGEDYETYPRNIEQDRKLAAGVGGDIVFAPSVSEMYPDGYATYVEVERLTKELCGRSRPHHFRGVTTVVTKLFNIVRPDRAYFGQKDYQQAVVIKRMTTDLHLGPEIVVMPIIREPDGLALSSRNSYLSKEQRKAALVLYRSLKKAEDLLNRGERAAERIKDEIAQLIKQEPLVEVEYISVVDSDNLTELAEIKGQALIALAVRIGETRLIDNILWEDTASSKA